MHADSALHQRVLQSLGKLRIPGLDEPLVEREGSRLDLPNEFFQSRRKGVGQRKRNLCYTDALLHADRVPRVLIKVVDNNPTGPNGITGLTVNVDRIADVHPNFDLLFVVLAELKDFYCNNCRGGHRVTNAKKSSCLRSYLERISDDVGFRELIHSGKAANFKKALIDYPIGRYLLNISPPSVLFLNINSVAKEWATYESHALALIQCEVTHIISSARRSETRLVATHELIPKSIAIPERRENGLLGRVDLGGCPPRSPTDPEVCGKKLILSGCDRASAKDFHEIRAVFTRRVA